MSPIEAPRSVRVRAALLVGVLTIAIGLGGIIHPDSLTELRRWYFATPATLYIAAAFRAGMGLVLILAAPAARWPRALRAVGIVMCMQATSAAIMGPEQARAILEWETVHSALLRIGGFVALLSGAFIISATATSPRHRRN